MADNQPKKKRFVYKSVVGNNKNPPTRHEPAPPLVDFPDDFDALTQPSKKQKLNSSPVVKKKKTDDMFDDIDFNDDDDDFDLNEIEQIEIAASQQIVKKITKISSQRPIPKVDVLDELLDFSPRPNAGKKKVSAATNYSSTAHRQQNSTVYLSQRHDSNKVKYAPEPKDKANDKTTNPNKEMLEQSFQKQYHQSQKLVSEYKTKVETIQRKSNSKDGEIKILREKLRKSSEDEHRFKEKIVLLENASRTEQSNKETDLLKRVEKLKTQLEFKEKEVKDAIEKQKQSERPPPQRRPSFVSPTKAEQIPDGFKATTATPKQLKQSNKLETKESIAEPKKEDVTTKIFKGKPWVSLHKCLHNVSAHSTRSSTIVKKLSSITSVNQSFIADNFKCSHSKHTSPFTDHNNNTLYKADVQSSLELLEQNDFFVAEFIGKTLVYLKKLRELFDSQVEREVTSASQEEAKSAKQKLQRKDSGGNSTCHLCVHLLEIGYKGLFTLKESCKHYNCVRVYLLSCFAVKRSKSKRTRNYSQVIEYFNKILDRMSFKIRNLECVTKELQREKE